MTTIAGLAKPPAPAPAASLGNFISLKILAGALEDSMECPQRARNQLSVISQMSGGAPNLRGT